MPIMDGFESVKKMREYEALHWCDDKNPSVIVGISANSEEQMTELSQKAGMDAFLTKPFRIQNLIEVYEKIKEI